VHIPLELDGEDPDRFKMKRLLDCACLIKCCELFPHTPLWDSLLSAHIHDHHMDGMLQEYDLFEMDHLELALFLFIMSIS
jgi:hypothetical protein